MRRIENFKLGRRINKATYHLPEEINVKRNKK